MKIAVIGQHDNYGCMGTWVADAIEDNGYQVYRVDRKQPPIPGPQRFDLLLYVDCSEDFSNMIPNVNIPKVFWSMDVHMPGGSERSCSIARRCDLVFSSNYEHGVKILEKFGVESLLLPVTYNDRLSYPGKRKIYDIVMIGHENSVLRSELWDMLNNYYNAFTGVAKKADDYEAVMSQTKMVVNQPTEPWDNILNNRFFEAMATRSLLLQKRLTTRLIEKLGFIENEDFVYWNDFSELKTKIDYYLSRDKEREAIAGNGHLKVLKYSMRHQCITGMNVILSKFYDQIE